MSAIFLIAIHFLLLKNIYQAQNWMTATPEQFFIEHQYWRAWTTLFAHADLLHLLSNALLFLPLVYLLTAYFDFWLFPFLGILIGGVTNMIVLKTLSTGTTLLGISGVVYWMGAVWFTLFYLIDQRKNAKARFAHILFLMLMLFIPETYEPHVSYLSHFLGFLFGILSGLIYYYFHRAEFNKAIVIEVIEEPDQDELEELSFDA